MARVNFGMRAPHVRVFHLLKSWFSQRRLGDLLIAKGIISHRTLQQALTLQKNNHKPLGQILLEHNLIKRGQLQRVLVRQKIIRLCAGVMLFSFGLLDRAPARADIADAGGRISVVTTSSIQPVLAHPGLFGTNEKRSEDLSAFTKWSGMFTRFEQEIDNPADRPILQKWRTQIAEFRGMPLLEMAQHVNDMMNAHPYVLDSRNWGVSDYWETPLEFLKKGGDCEDFAIAKYLSLRALGVPESRLRVAVVQDTQKNIPHAILALYADDGVYVLDNQNKSLMNASHSGRYRPIFSINREAWWLHTGQDLTLVASR